MSSLLIFILAGGAVLFGLSRISRKEFFDPMFLVPLYWYAVIAASLAISSYFGLYWHTAGIWSLLLMLIAFVAGTLVMRTLEGLKKPLPADHGKGGYVFSPVRLAWMTVFFSLAGLMAIRLQLDFLNLRLSSISDLFIAANTISQIRYNGGTEMPAAGQFLMAFLYASAFSGGVLALTSRKWLLKLTGMLPFIVIALFTVINGVKSGFIFITIIWISAYLSAMTAHRKGPVQKPLKLTIRALLIVSVLILMIPVTQLLRGGRSNEKIEWISPGVISYFGSFNAYSLWISNNKESDMTGLRYSLSGFHNVFFGGREVGLYGKQNTLIGEYNDAPVLTNVYTINRGFIEDFSFPGTLFFLFVSGILARLIYRKVTDGNLFAVCLYAMFISVLLWSITVNILNYNTIIFAWMLCLGSVFVVRKRFLSISST
jgi:oligosaccharide repeat unit polymerase